MILNLAQLREDYKATYKVAWNVAKKIAILIEVTKIESNYQDKYSQAGKRVAITDILHAAEISLRTLQRWKKCYKEKSIYGLTPKQRGHKSRIEIDYESINIIKFYRETYRWGSEVIQAHLRFDHKVFISRFKIDRYLKESGLKNEYPCTTIKKKITNKKKHTKVVVVDTPGKHTQMDVKYQTHLLENKCKAYVYNIIDHASNWSYKKAYDRITALNTDDFVRCALEVCPFKIERLQTDNGVEFTYKWTSKNPDDPKEHPLLKLCAEKEIIHKLIPPGEKELQGLVERSHRQDDQELFSRIKPYDLKEFNVELERFYKHRNSWRRFKKLGWKSPNMWLNDYKDKEINELKESDHIVDKDAA